MSENSIKVKQTQTRAQCIAQIEALLAGLRAGHVTLTHADRTLTLTPADALQFTLEARDKGEKQGLTLELRWRNDQPTESPGPLTISAAPPPPASPAS